MQTDSLTANNHYTNPTFARKGSEFSSHNSTAIDFDPNNKNTQGIKVTTDFIDNSLTENQNPIHDDWDDHDPSLFAHRVLKKGGGSMLESIGRLNNKYRAKTHISSDKILFEKLGNIEKARLTKTTSQRHAKDPKSKIIRYQLEDFDENLDEDRISLASLVFKALEPSSTLEINPVYEAPLEEENKNEDEHQHDSHDEVPFGTEIKNLSQLKHKLTDIKLLNDKGGYTALGKIEYKRWKHRAYDVQKKLMYKIIKGEVHDDKSQTLHINDDKGKKVGTILITHISSKVAKCEIDFPKDCDSKKKLILIGILFAILDRLEPLDETSFFRKIINTAFFGLSCTT